MSSILSKRTIGHGFVAVIAIIFMSSLMGFGPCGQTGTTEEAAPETESGTTGETGGGSTTTEAASVTSDYILSAGHVHVCAIKKADSTLWCWGSDEHGRVGDGITSGESWRKIIPTRVGTTSDWANVFAGYGGTCAIKADNTMWCWGHNHYGSVGDGTAGVINSADNDKNEPVQEVTLATNWKQATVGYEHTCAVKQNGTLWCWGGDAYGQLGDGMPNSDRREPTQIGADADWKTVSTYDFYNSALKADGSIWHWGGFGADEPKGVGAVPVRMGTDNNWTTVSSYHGSACALKDDGSLWCWGAASATPARIGADNDWKSISATGSVLGGHKCALKNNGSLWCWGRNYKGSLGDGTETDRSEPTRVGADSDWAQASCGTYSTLGERAGSIWFWGDNQYGGNGNGAWSLDPVLTPMMVNPF